MVSDKKPAVVPVYIVSLFLHFYWNIVDLQASQVVLVVKNLPANAGYAANPGLIPGWGRSPGGERSNLLQYSCLENPMDRGAWGAVVLGAAKIRTRLKQLSTHVGIVDFQCCVAFLKL